MEKGLNRLARLKDQIEKENESDFWVHASFFILILFLALWKRV